MILLESTKRILILEDRRFETRSQEILNKHAGTPEEPYIVDMINKLKNPGSRSPEGWDLDDYGPRPLSLDREQYLNWSYKRFLNATAGEKESIVDEIIILVEIFFVFKDGLPIPDITGYRSLGHLRNVIEAYLKKREKKKKESEEYSSRKAMRQDNLKKAISFLKLSLI